MLDKATAPGLKSRRGRLQRETFVHASTRAIAFSSLILLFALPAAASEPNASTPPVRNLWGEVGLLDMPNARMTDDGMLTFTFAAMQNTQRYNFDFQLMPWIDTTFRYGHVSGPNGFADYHRNLGFKMRLFQESEDFPEISLGIRDMIGTGRQGAEYLVFSKAVGDFDVTAGVGWGRLSNVDTFPNPLALVIKSFETRSVAPVTGGTPAFGQIFHGPGLGLFGGIDWRTPIDGLDLIAEYSSDKYTYEAQRGVMQVRSPFNVGMSYAIFDNLRIMGSWMYGSTFGANVIYTKDPTKPLFFTRIGPAKPEPRIRTDQEQVAALSGLVGRDDGDMPPMVSSSVQRQQTLDQALFGETKGVRDLEVDGQTLLVNATYYENADEQCRDYARVVQVNDSGVDSIALTNSSDPSGSVALCNVDRSKQLRLVDASGTETRSDTATAKIRADVAVQQLELAALSLGSHEIWLYYRNDRYFSQAEAAGRLARLLMADAPAHVEIFHVILVEHGVAIREFRFVRSALERAITTSGGTQELADAVAVDLPPVDQPILDATLMKTEPRFTWAIGPGLRQSFFDPRSPIQIEIEWVASADLELAPGLDLVGEVDGNVYNNFDTKLPAVSDLPHVRSDINQYLIHGINGVGQLELDYRSRLAPDIYSDFRVGYLEDMYAGVGGQILWRPDGGRLSFGVDLYQVWKRDFNRLNGLQSYNILTGHFTIYYNSPWYGLNFNVHAGRYLAGDYGATIEVSRKFSTGVEIGAFATFTNVPFSKFGEGSFDKGFIVRIPFEWPLPIYTVSQKTTVLHSLTRDGGQRLNNDDPLYQETRDASYGEILDHQDELTNP